MKTTFSLLSAAVLIAACKPREVPAPVPVAPQATATKETAGQTPKPPVPAGGGGVAIVAGDANLPELNRALRAYVTKFNRPPQSLNDLAKEGLIKFIPFAPPGMRYELDAARGEVKLVNVAAK